MSHRHPRRVSALVAAAVAATVLPLMLARPAAASHVGAVTVTPPLGISALDVCAPFVVTTAGGGDPTDAVVDVEVRGSAPAEFCLPAAGLNPVDIDPATGDLGPGPVEIDGNIGGEATTAPGTLLGEGEFTFGIKSSQAGAFDITVFVEEPGAGNDDPDGSEPQDVATLFALLGGGDNNGTEVPGATNLVNALDCVPEEDIDPSGSRHDFICRATTAAGAPVVGAEVRRDVIAGPNAEEVGAALCGYTDVNGSVVCSYQDAEGAGSPPGTDTVVGFTGSDLATSLNQDEIRVTFAGDGAGSGATKVASKVTIKKRFKGRVRSAVKSCKTGRKVVVKKVRKGRDRVVGRDRTNRRGKYVIRKRGAKGRFYAVAKKKRYTSSGSTIVCKSARSKRVRRR